MCLWDFFFYLHCNTINFLREKEERRIEKERFYYPSLEKKSLTPVTEGSHVYTRYRRQLHRALRYAGVPLWLQELVVYQPYLEVANTALNTGQDLVI